MTVEEKGICVGAFEAHNTDYLNVIVVLFIYLFFFFFVKCSVILVQCKKIFFIVVYKTRKYLFSFSALKFHI